MKRKMASKARARGMKLMEQAVEKAVSRLKEKYPPLVEFMLDGRENYSREVEREGFFHIDRQKGEFSQPLKAN